MTDFLDCMRPAVDDTPRPCLHRITHTGVSRYETSTTWCLLDDGHDGPCRGPEPTVLVPNRFGPEEAKRRRW